MPLTAADFQKASTLGVSLGLIIQGQMSSKGNISPIQSPWERAVLQKAPLHCNDHSVNVYDYHYIVIVIVTHHNLIGYNSQQHCNLAKVESKRHYPAGTDPIH